MMKRPSTAAWNEWAEQQEDDHAEEEEEEQEDEDAKDYSTSTKAQCSVFDRALKLPPGTRGSCPNEIQELWASIKSGPGTVAERHALRNARVPKDAGYGHACTVDPNGITMQQNQEWV